MHKLTTEELITIIEQSEVAITEASIQIAAAVKELKDRHE